MKYIHLILLLFCSFVINGNNEKIIAPHVPDSKKLPIVYHSKYNISFFGIEKIHPFDSTKYGKIAAFITRTLNLSNSHFYKPESEVSSANLSKVHTKRYLDSLNDSKTIEQITEVPLVRFVSNKFLQDRVVSHMRYATQGTIVAAQVAMERGVGINLGGGYHHAKADEGHGFCPFADIPLAMKILWEEIPNLKIMYVDLDAHQGNGVESILKDDPNVYIFDCYNENNYPWDKDAQQYIKKHIVSKDIYCDACLKKGACLKVHEPYNLWTKPCKACNDAYLASLKRELPLSIQEFQPHIIFYNAGTDPFEGDLLGRMYLSENGIIERDEFVFQQAQENKVAICMTLSGGYSRKSGPIVGKSIVNLYQKGLLDIR